ncbi:uncharacterized protein [Triticum aestivum]|uniref:uncharacterized protein n=1 Tax=Triticum aestivum TaxID=4565 RepID=UPI001D03425F|nr:uncharacterized protein LOC123121244 [Triticum aestivum]
MRVDGWTRSNVTDASGPFYTRLAVSFPAASTTADLKRRVSHEHAATFPDIGQIAVQSIKVEHRGLWFHLADSMAVRDAFQFHGINQAWHLQLDAALLPMAEGHSCLTAVSDSE